MESDSTDAIMIHPKQYEELEKMNVSPGMRNLLHNVFTPRRTFWGILRK